ncbi:hypothetical protein [Pararhizobium gei]|uniref:hypothetical protein n=1 Tax=Pararhizobium gei TaxID=1395951 RepID=UPI0023DC85A2|nr:hypothetical protein [Rhizobium gei]
MSYFTDEQAREIWKARWRGETVQSLVGKYGENQFRLYEVWEEKKNEGTRLIAYEEFKRENPEIAALTNPIAHIPRRKVISFPKDNGQLGLFA